VHADIFQWWAASRRTGHACLRPHDCYCTVVVARTDSDRRVRQTLYPETRIRICLSPRCATGRTERQRRHGRTCWRCTVLAGTVTYSLIAPSSETNNSEQTNTCGPSVRATERVHPTPGKWPAPGSGHSRVKRHFRCTGGPRARVGWPILVAVESAGGRQRYADSSFSPVDTPKPVQEILRFPNAVVLEVRQESSTFTRESSVGGQHLLGIPGYPITCMTTPQSLSPLPTGLCCILAACDSPKPSPQSHRHLHGILVARCDCSTHMPSSKTAR
jgi:hypothetical protein